MIRRPVRPEPRRGAAAVEFAVASLFLVPLLIGLWEVGRMVEVQQLLANAAREGGRQASTGNVDANGVKTVVASYLTRNNITCAASNVTVVNLTSGSRADPKAANQFDQFQVTVTIPFDTVRWVLLTQITNVRQLTASATWVSMKDLPLTVNPNIPLN